MVNATSNTGYLNRIVSPREYYNARNTEPRRENTEASASVGKVSYINNDAVRYVEKLRSNARNMLDSLENITPVRTFSVMQNAYESAAEDTRSAGINGNDSGNGQDVGETDFGGERSVFAAEDNGSSARSVRTQAGPAGDNAGPVRTGVATAEAENSAARAPARRAENAALQSRSGRIESASTRAPDAGAIRDMAGSFNRLLETAESGMGNSRLARDLRDASNSFASSLGRVGITVNDSGGLSIDESRLARSERTGALGRSFSLGGDNEGFANRLTRIAEEVTGDRSIRDRTGDNGERQNGGVLEYPQNANDADYSYAYGYSAPGTLFNLYA